MEEDSLVEYGFRRVIITITAILCTLLEIVDTTIVNVALDEMKGNLGATLSQIGWVITAYAIGNVIIIPMTSWLSQQFGRRNYFAASIIIFTIFSFLCGNSTGLWELVIFRFFQGLGGGALLATSQTIITESYPREKLGMSQAIYGMGVIIGPTLGPPLGGYIVDHFSWPHIFYINVPLGIIATLLTLQFVRSPRYEKKKKAKDVDWLGILLLSCFVGSLQFVLEKGQEDDWFESTAIVTFTILAILSFFFFLWRQMTFRYPIVNLKVLKNGNLRIGTMMTFILGFGLYGSTFIIPIYTQGILGWTATQAGLLMIPSALATGFMMPFIGKLISKGVRQQYLAGAGFLIFFIYSFWGYKLLTPDTGESNFFWMLIVRGIGLGLLFIPITTLSLSTLQGKEIGDGVALTGMMRQLGGSFGIALITTFVARRTALYYNNLSSYMDITNFAVQQRINQLKAAFMSKGMPPDIALQSAYKTMKFTLQKQATVLSYMDVFLYLGLLFLVCIPFIILARDKKGKGNQDLTSALH